MDLPSLLWKLLGDARSWVVKQFLDWGWKVAAGGALGATIEAVLAWGRGLGADEIFNGALLAAVLGMALVAISLVVLEMIDTRRARRLPAAATAMPANQSPSPPATGARSGAPAVRFFVNHHGARWEDECRRDPLGRPIMRGPLCLFHYERLTYIQEPNERVPKDDDFFGKGASGRLWCPVCNDALGAYSNAPLTRIGESREGARDLVEYITERMRAPGAATVGDPRQLVRFGIPEDLCEDGFSTRWAIPVAAAIGRFESCSAFLFVDGQMRRGAWVSSPLPSEYRNLDADKSPSMLPVAIRPNRCDMTGVHGLPMGVARLMNGTFYGKDPTRKFDLEPGTRRIELRILWSEFEWRSPPYILTVPPSDEIVNLHFTLKRLD